MSTTPYGANDPFSSTPPEPVDPLDAPTPIGDELTVETSTFDTPATGTGTSSTDSSGGGLDSAKETAKDALGSASEHGSHVAETAKDEAVKVAAEAKEKATDLLADVKSQVDEQSKAQLQGLAAKLGELADEIQSMVSGSETSNTVTGVAQQLADKTHELSSHLESRQPLDLLDDVRGFARRRPAAFLAGAAVAGVLAGRLTRGAKASHGTNSGPSTSSTIGDPPSIGTTSAPPLGTSSVPPLGTTMGAADDVQTGQNMGGRQ
jgi:vacuolar-type H+-ATPase subunit H